VPHSTAYYKPVEGVTDAELAVMHLLDKLHTKHPFLGSRRMSQVLRERHRVRVNRKRVRRLMQLMGIQAIYPKPRTSRAGRGPSHKVFPYLLSGVNISAANDVWSADITYIPMALGFCCLVAIMDVASRRNLAWRLSNTLDSRFCVEALEEALVRYGTPAIFNTDQGAQTRFNRWSQHLVSGGATWVGQRDG